METKSNIRHMHIRYMQSFRKILDNFYEKNHL